MTAGDLAAALARYRVRAATEARLQDAFAEIAAREGWVVRREHPLGPGAVPDFFFPDGGLAVELKVGGARAAVERQLARYAEFDAVRALALVTTRRAHTRLVERLAGKPVAVIRMDGAFA